MQHNDTCVSSSQNKDLVLRLLAELAERMRARPLAYLCLVDYPTLGAVGKSKEMLLRAMKKDVGMEGLDPSANEQYPTQHL